MNFRTQQTCLQCTDSDNALLLLEPETIPLPNFPLLQDSQHFVHGVPVELPTNGAKHPADTLADARDYGFDFVSRLLLHCPNFLTGFPSSHRRRCSSHSMLQSVELSRRCSLPFTVKSIDFFPRFRSGPFSSEQQQRQLHLKLLMSGIFLS